MPTIIRLADQHHYCRDCVPPVDEASWWKRPALTWWQRLGLRLFLGQACGDYMQQMMRCYRCNSVLGQEDNGLVLEEWHPNVFATMAVNHSVAPCTCYGAMMGRCDCEGKG
jgi:hypothetical protein